LYIGRNPAPSPAGLGATSTALVSGRWKLWRWSPSSKPQGYYHYILVSDYGTDPIIYQRDESCVGAAEKTTAGA
jgi:hypothetical protein